MVCQFLPDVPADCAGLLSEFVDIANFLKVRKPFPSFIFRMYCSATPKAVR